jgi:hypothetical protein
MSEFFFEDNKCGIGNKVEKPTFKFVADCDIEPTPPPIFDCPLPIIPREQAIPCPEFDVKSKIDVKFKGDNCPSDDTSISFKITKQKSPDGCIKNECEGFDVELDILIALPVPPCPVIKTNTPKIKTVYKDTPCVDEENTFKVTSRRIKRDCEDPFDLGECEFEFDLTLTVPIPRPPCPKFNTKFKVKTDYIKCLPPTPSKFEITPRHKQPANCEDPVECEFDVDLEINIPLPTPPCPKINIKHFKIVPLYPICIPPPPFNACPGQNKFIVTRREKKPDCEDLNGDSGQCEFDFELEIVIPQPKIPCPDIKIKKFIVKSDFKKCIIPGGQPPPQNRFEITRKIIPCKCDEPERCEFEIELELNIPLPEPPCPEIKVTSFKIIPLYPVCIPPPPFKACPAESKFNIKRTKKEVQCDGNLANPQCDFDVELEIVIPQPKMPCPELKIKKFEVKADYKRCLGGGGGGNRFEIVKRIIPCTCEEPERCEFDIELEIVIPLPEPPCPDIKVKNFNVNYVKYDPIKTPTPPIPPNCNKLIVTKTTKLVPCLGPIIVGQEIVPEQTGATGPCEFEIDLQICVPVPEIRCPVIKVNKFKIETKYEDCVQQDSKFEIKRNPNNTQECEFNVDLEIYVPLPKVPCPEIKTNLYLETFLDTPNCGTPGGVFDVTLETIPSGSCNEPDICLFDFILELYIPIPRFVEDVTFNIIPPKLTVDWCVPGNQKISKLDFKLVRKVDKWIGTCDHGQSVEYDAELSLDIVIPRPPCNFIKLRPKLDEFVIKRTTKKEEYFKLRIDTLPDVGCNPCEYEFDIDIQLQCPPCPKFFYIIGKNFKYYPIERTVPPKIDIRFEPRIKPDCEYPCEYDIYIDLYSPKFCLPEFKRQPTNYNPCYYTTRADLEVCTPDPDEYLQIDIVLVDPEECKYDVYVYTKPPVYQPSNACDEFLITRFEVKDCQTDITASRGELEITARTKADSDDHCTYDVELDLYLKAAQFEPGQQNLTFVEVTNLDQIEPNKYLKIWIDPPSTDCVYKINADIKIPVLLPYCSGNVTVKSSGGAEIGVGTLVCSHQNADYTIDIVLDTVGCDEATGGTLPFTALPMTAAPESPNKTNASSIPPVEVQPAIIKQYSPLVQEFIRALKADAELREVVKEILRT